MQRKKEKGVESPTFHEARLIEVEKRNKKVKTDFRCYIAITFSTLLCSLLDTFCPLSSNEDLRI